METVDQLAELENLLQVQFRDRSLLERALTHHSCCPETSVRDSYDTLEFLGDALLGAFVVEYIYRTFPHRSEGEMTALKSEVVSRRVLAAYRAVLFPPARGLGRGTRPELEHHVLGIRDNGPLGFQCWRPTQILNLI